MEQRCKWLSPQRLVTLLGQQRDLYLELRSLSQRQRTLIAGPRPELLLDVLTQRQRIIARLAEINEQLSPVRREWEVVYGGLPEELRRKTGALLAEINEALQTILSIDKEDSALLAARKQSTAQELGRQDRRSAANAAYTRNQGESGTTDSADLRV